MQSKLDGTDKCICSLLIISPLHSDRQKYFSGVISRSLTSGACFRGGPGPLGGLSAPSARASVRNAFIFLADSASSPLNNVLT